jgi:excisionase family DNA binding protein
MTAPSKAEGHDRTPAGLPRLYTSRQVAEALGISRERVTQLVRDGKLAAVRFGPRGRYRFPTTTVERLIADATHQCGRNGPAQPDHLDSASDDACTPPEPEHGHDGLHEAG